MAKGIAAFANLLYVGHVACPTTDLLNSDPLLINFQQSCAVSLPIVSDCLCLFIYNIIIVNLHF